MNRILGLLVAFAFAASPVFAQASKEQMTIRLKDGRAVPATLVERSGDMVNAFVQNGPSPAKVGFPAADVVSLDGPVPVEVGRVGDLITMGKPDQALLVLEPVYRRQASLRDISGNRWEEVALAKVEALSAAGQVKESEQLFAELSAASKDPGIGRRLKIKQAAVLARQGKHREAIAVYDEIVKKEADREALAAAWLNKGQSLLATGDNEQAALCFLRVPVFYSDIKNLVPPAMLGAARAMAGMGDRNEAENRYRQLVEQFPASPDGKTAKKELEKLSGKTPPTTNENTTQ